MSAADTMSQPIVSVRRATTRPPRRMIRALRRARLRQDLELLGATGSPTPPSPSGMGWRTAFLIWLLETIAFAAVLRVLPKFFAGG